MTDTPTDDEREALAKAMCAIETRSKAATLEEVQAGIQRWTRHRYEADRLIEELAEYGFSLRRSEVPKSSAEVVALKSQIAQGEPSDAQIEAAMKEASRRSLMWRTSSDVKAVLLAAQGAR